MTLPDAPKMLALVTGVAISVTLLALASAVHLPARFELRAFDYALFLAAPPIPVSAVAVVGRDDEDLRLLGPALDDSTLAAVIDTLLNIGVSSVTIDLLRDGPVGAGQDALLAAVGRAGARVRFVTGPTSQPWLPKAQAVDGRVLVDGADGRIRRVRLASFPNSQLMPAAVGASGLSPVLLESVSGLKADAPGPYGEGEDVSQSALFVMPSDARALPELTLRALLSHGRTAADQTLLSSLTGRAVFLGNVAPGSGDTHPVAYSSFWPSGDLPGVRLLAAQAAYLGGVAGNVLPAIRPWSQRATTAWLALWILGGALVGCLLSGRVSLLAVLGSPLLLMGMAIPAIRAGHLMPMAVPWMGFAGAVAGSILMSRRNERRQRQFTQLLFARFMTPQLADEAWAQRRLLLANGRPRPIELFATVLLADLRGSTAMAEALSASELLAVLGSLSESMAMEVSRAGGLVIDYAGDGLMAVFGAPIPRTTETERRRDAKAAVDCAGAMVARVDHLSKPRRERGLPPLRVRVGIHSGNVVAGVIGGGQRLTYTVVGDTVHIAARLEQLGKEIAPGDENSVLLSDKTAALLDNGDALTSIGEQGLRGLAVQVTAYRLTPGPAEE